MENKRPKKYLLLFAMALTVIAVVSFRLSYRTLQTAAPALVSTAETQNQNQKPAADKNLKLFPVERVIDGDTIVANIDGQSVHIRLIGINSPELNDKRPPVACSAKKAKDATEKLLDNKKIYLEKDPTQGDYDKYGRLLAYIFIEGGTFFNKLMIEEGYAYEYTYRLPYKYQGEFKAAEQEARMNQRGLWKPEVCSN